MPVRCGGTSGKPLTGGVASRVATLADRPEGFRPAGAKPFANLVPLVELLGGVRFKARARPLRQATCPRR